MEGATALGSEGRQLPGAESQVLCAFWEPNSGPLEA